MCHVHSTCIDTFDMLFSTIYSYSKVNKKLPIIFNAKVTVDSFPTGKDRDRNITKFGQRIQSISQLFMPLVW